MMLLMTCPLVVSTVENLAILHASAPTKLEKNLATAVLNSATKERTVPTSYVSGVDVLATFPANAHLQLFRVLRPFVCAAAAPTAPPPVVPISTDTKEGAPELTLPPISEGSAARSVVYVATSAARGLRGILVQSVVVTVARPAISPLHARRACPNI
mmetsp:Transcript_34096/g.61467  ORF Transcript_34096/g.61467 Transcript_34096/m.61467 type:complete len:157 (+) Transcript_34096:480-950(+)